MDGKLQCRQAITARHARIGPHAEWKGDLQAASLDVKPGAVIHGGRFEIPSTRGSSPLSAWPTADSRSLTAT